MPMGWVAAAGAAMNLVGGLTSSQGQLQGAQQQVGGLQQGSQALQTGFQNAGPYLTNAYNTASGSYSPYTATGALASNTLGDLINSGYATNQFNNQDLNAQLAPNYAFQLGQGQQTTNASNNSLGGMLGGNALQGLQQYTQNYAGNAYQQAFTNYQNQRNSILGNLGNIAGQGLTATNNLAGITTGYGGSMANLNTSLAGALAGNYGQQGTAAGSGTVGAANTMGNTYSGIGTQLGQLAGNYFGQPNQPQDYNNIVNSTGFTPTAGNSFNLPIAAGGATQLGGQYSADYMSA